MPTPFEQSILNLVDNAIAANVAGAATLKSALDVALASGGSSTSGECTCSCSEPIEFNKFRTLLKEDAPGFTNESLTAVVRSEDNRDVIVVHGCNKFREMHTVFELTVRPGMRVDRESVKGQLKLGVLKVTGRTYKSKTPIGSMDLSDQIIPIVMA